jgi:cation diffusion facilitator family transporter
MTQPATGPAKVASTGVATGNGKRKERAALLSILASTVITVGKGVAGLMTGSLALISDAAHSLLDVAATTMTYLAVRAAGKPADEEHHYGHGKVEAVAALAETAFLFVLSGVIAYEGIRRLWSGETQFNPSWLAVGVLVASIVIDAWRWWALKKVARETGSEALEADALHFSADLVNSVLVLAAFGAGWMGFMQADALVAVGVALFIGVAGYKVGRRTLDTLIDAAPAGAADLIRHRASTVPGVVGIDWLRVRGSGGELIGELGIRVSRTLPLDRVAAIKQDVIAAIGHDGHPARLTVTANPVAMDDETILERIMLIAARRRVPIHHVTVQTVGTRLCVSLDLEIDGRMSLKAAHTIATRVEDAIRAEFGEATEVETHIEPLEVTHLSGREAEATLVARIATTLAEQAGAEGVLRELHHVRVRETPAGLVVNYHCRVDPDLDVLSVHAAVDAMERRVRVALPQVARLVGHAEPAQA